MAPSALLLRSFIVTFPQDWLYCAVHLITRDISMAGHITPSRAVHRIVMIWHLLLIPRESLVTFW